MADSRGFWHRSPCLHANAEVALLDWLNKSEQLIPKKRKDFMVFIYKYFDSKDFSESVVNSVWMKLKNFEKKIKECPTIVLSSDEEKSSQVTEVLDFDEMNSENEPNITVLQVPQPTVKSPEKKKREYHRTPTKIKGLFTTEDQALLKKFKQQIILEELLKRDKEMLKIQQKKDKFQSAVQIEMGYAKRIQKDRVEALAQEMLRLHKEGFRDGLSTSNLAKFVCLVEPPKFIPSESVIAERLPSPDPNNEILSEELPSDHINYEMLYPSGEANTSYNLSKTEKKVRKRHSDPSKIKQGKKKRSLSKSFSGSEGSTPSKKSKRDIEADLLRQRLYIDTLIEMALPEVIEEVDGAHRLTRRNSNINSC